MTGVLFLAGMLAVIGALDWLGVVQVQHEIRRKLEAEESARRVAFGLSTVDSVRFELPIAWGTCPDCTTPARCGSEQWCSKGDVEDPVACCMARR